MVRSLLLSLALVFSFVALSISWAAAQSGGPPPQPAPGTWSVTVPNDQADVIVTNSDVAATYRITSGSESSWTVKVIRLDSAGAEINGSAEDLEAGDSIDFGIGVGEGIKIVRRGTGNGSADGTYQKV